MKGLTTFEDPFRPLYEKWSVGVWLASSLLSALVTFVSPYPSFLFYWLSAFFLVMAAVRAWPAMKLWQVQAAMGDSRELPMLTREELMEICAQRPDSLFMGWGFEWTQEQAQITYTLGRYSPEKLVPRREGDMGHKWIHGIGAMTEKPLFVPFDHLGTHTLIVGTTGAGKTRTFDSLIAQTIARGMSVLIIDPKGDKEMCESARMACVELGRPDDFVYFHPAHPEKSVRIDPLKNFNRPTELASRIASLIPSETGSDPFAAFAMMAINKLCESLLFIHEKPSLILLRRLLEGGMYGLMIKVIETHAERVMPGYDANGAELNDGWVHLAKPYVNKGGKGSAEENKALALIQFYRDIVMKDHSNPIVEGLMASIEHDSSHFGKMVTSLMPVLTMLTSGAMGDLLSPNYDDPDDERPITDFGKITRNGQVAYIGLDSLSDAMVASAVGALFLSDLTAVAGDRYNFGTKDDMGVKVALFVDEAAEVVNPPLIQLLNKGRGSGFSVYLATQTLSDFITRLGSKDMAYKVLGNINNIFFLRANDIGTQEYLADALPQVIVRKVDASQSAKNEVDHPLIFSGTISESLSEEEVPLVAADLMSCIPNLEGFAKMSAGRFVKWRSFILVPKKAA
ncbi:MULTISPECIES: conjugative transfer system coupling protein TraD [Stenotrophomonas]|uniref:conjugative transfer system coupling protein TraD n=1 Tax=Stenotrophomonas TaxID=40323 RepID=UPI0021C609D0|nr:MULTISPECIES: conjugative transfer system coupling protein TraD [Stenotrophomonas]MCU1136939.1 conjugative transfer system coupling protein TraD [Stenotrophomonas maltophilia]MEC4339737.1 conjugative transfer system coupling protein TraD [Stenotrophomonas pavanii]